MSAKKSKKKKVTFGLPPHINAAPHKALMEKLSRMSTEEIFQTAVQAGIYTKSGKLTKHYASPSSNSSGSARASRSGSAYTSRSRSSARRARREPPR